MKHLLAIFLIGVSCFLFGCGSKEISSPQKIVTQSRKTTAAHTNLGLTYFNQGKYDLAIESYQKAISINPDYAKAHYNLGNAYGQQGKSDLAIESFKKTLRINPDLDSSQLRRRIHSQQTKEEYNSSVLT